MPIGCSPFHALARVARCFCLAVTCWLLTAPLAAQPAARTPDAEESEADLEPRSPRACLDRFLDLSRATRYAEAGRYLDLPKAREAERADLARRLRAVIARRGKLDPAKLSENPAGDLSDALPASLEKVGTVTEPDGLTEPLRMTRGRADGVWRFSSATVAKIDAWYAALPDRFLIERLPAWLQQPGPREVPRWQWLALALAALLSLTLGFLASSLLRRGLAGVFERTKTTWDDRLLSRLRGPITVALALALLRAALPFLYLYPTAVELVQKSLHGLFLANLLWTVWRLVDAFAEIAWDSSWSHGHAARALIPLARRIGKAAVAIAAAVVFLATLGYSVTSLVAGLGIGGLALALASQKTFENLFGAFSLGVDQPFREGDFVRIEDLVGTVESLGLRSTKIRTLDRTIVSIPNGKLADMRLETFAARDRLRLACMLGLEYGTRAEQMRAVLVAIEGALRNHPKIWSDSMTVRFKELAESSLNIEIMAWFTTTDWDEFMLIRQDVLLEIMAIVERNGCAFAFPSRTVHLRTDDAPAVEPPRTSRAGP
jgi:MscS family membrane protein